MNKKTIRDIDIKNKKVLMRVDFNVPLDKDLNITDDSRIQAALPTIKYILKNNAKLILASHLGRPKGKIVNEMRLTPVAGRLSGLLGREVMKLDDCIGRSVKDRVNDMKEGDVMLLENLRFHKEETDNNEGFAKQLAGLGEIYVNDAFGACHRAHASTAGVAKFLPAAAGFLVEKEIEYFEKILKSNQRPFVLILGGAKVSDKIGVIDNLLDRVDTILIGGGMAYTFYAAKGLKIGNSKLEADKVKVAEDILQKVEKKGIGLVLPVDNLIARKVEQVADVKIVGQEIPDGWMGLDVGPKTTREFKKHLLNARTVLWNGPLGVFEIKKFSRATEEITRFLAGLNITTVIGGGDTAAAITALGLTGKMSHVSTGGGASLEYLEGKTLPGIAALQDK
ncbi:MAG: phosphoglycerate kinase [Candidatus Omnitrophota bacterium]|nr:phosphoglycerate kinase [Candidatus Omnitrophota bacterium]